MKEESLKKSEQQIGDLTQLLNDTEKQLTQYMSQLDQTQSTLETNEASYFKLCEFIFMKTFFAEESLRYSLSTWSQCCMWEGK